MRPCLRVYSHAWPHQVHGQHGSSPDHTYMWKHCHCLQCSRLLYRILHDGCRRLLSAHLACTWFFCGSQVKGCTAWPMAASTKGRCSARSFMVKARCSMQTAPGVAFVACRIWRLDSQHCNMYPLGVPSISICLVRNLWAAKTSAMRPIPWKAWSCTGNSPLYGYGG